MPRQQQLQQHWEARSMLTLQCLAIIILKIKTKHLEQIQDKKSAYNNNPLW